MSVCKSCCREKEDDDFPSLSKVFAVTFFILLVGVVMALALALNAYFNAVYGSTSSESKKPVLVEPTPLDNQLLNEAGKNSTGIAFLSPFASNTGPLKELFVPIKDCDYGVKLIETWINQGANINCKDSNSNYTPLMWCCYHGFSRKAQKLIELGADRSLKSDKDNKNALVIASECLSVSQQMLDRLQSTQAAGDIDPNADHKVKSIEKQINDYQKIILLLYNDKKETNHAIQVASSITYMLLQKRSTMGLRQMVG